jgi:hypothetical protein
MQISIMLNKIAPTMTIFKTKPNYRSVVLVRCEDEVIIQSNSYGASKLENFGTQMWHLATKFEWVQHFLTKIKHKLQPTQKLHFFKQ